MVKFIGSLAFGLALILAGCFAQSNGSAEAGDVAFVGGGIKFEKVVENVTTDVFRFVDCDASVVGYYTHRGMSVIPASEVDPTFMKNKCGLQ